MSKMQKIAWKRKVLLLVMGKVDVESVIQLKNIERVRRRSNVNKCDCSNQPKTGCFFIL
jgi:hypothetical protein